MTKVERILDIILRYQLTNADYEWYKGHEYVLRAIAANDFSVLSGYTQYQIDVIHDIYDTWCKALELTGKIDTELRYDRRRRSY